MAASASCAATEMRPLHRRAHALGGPVDRQGRLLRLAGQGGGQGGSRARKRQGDSVAPDRAWGTSASFAPRCLADGPTRMVVHSRHSLHSPTMNGFSGSRQRAPLWGGVHVQHAGPVSARNWCGHAAHSPRHEVGGRRSQDAASFVRKLARFAARCRARTMPLPRTRPPSALRWSAVLSFAAAQAFAASILSMPRAGTYNLDRELPLVSDVLCRLVCRPVADSSVADPC